MSKRSKYNLSPSDKINYVEKGSLKGQKKKGFKQFLFFVFVLALIALVFIPYWKNRQKKIELDREISQIKSDIYKYEKTNEELRELLLYLDSDQAIKDRARNSLGLQQEGEKVVVIKKREIEELVPGEKKKEEDELSNFQKWIKYIFKN